MISFYKINCIILEKKDHILRFLILNGIVKIFRLGAKLQIFVYNNGITFRDSK